MAIENGALHHLKSCGTTLVSHYTDDAENNYRTLRRGFFKLGCILEAFNEVTGMVTNIHKSIVVPIRFYHLYLDDIMQIFPIQHSNFEIKYPSLTLITRSQKNVDVDVLIDKQASKLIPWHGNNIAAADRGTLVKSVRTSQYIFHITSLGFPLNTLQTINKLVRSIHFVYG
jgi:hypothetical protein